MKIPRKEKNKLIEEWKIQGPREKAAREKRQIWYIEEGDMEEFKKTVAEAKRLLAIPEAPAMPVVHQGSIATAGGNSTRSKAGGNATQMSVHAEHIAEKGIIGETHWAMVHTPIPMPKAMKIPKAKEAVDKEWNKLISRDSWDYTSVVSKSELKKQAQSQGFKVHFGSLMDLCHEKGSELIPALRRYKGRVVFRGDMIRDETGSFAVFTEQSASASHMAAAKFLDAIARLPGCDGENDDAIGAYTQILFKDAMKLLGVGDDEFIETYISLPRERWPTDPELRKKWESIPDPVCILRRNLYGHPIAGLLWEKYCEKVVKEAGFKPIPGWECLYVHKQQQLFMSIYVDDFKMSGKKENLAPMWAKIGKSLDLEPASSLDGNVYLGCGQRNVVVPTQTVTEKHEFFDRLLHGTIDLKDTPEDAQENHLTQNKKVRKTKVKIPKAATSVPSSYKTQGYHYDMCGHAQQCVERYCELAKVTESTLKQVETPCIDDHMLQPEDFEKPGKLAPVAARIVLKFLYLARMGRPDLYWTVNVLARAVTKWTQACDKRLYRLTCYVHHTKAWTQTSFVGDKAEDCWLASFVDASFAGDLADSKSTTGAYIVLVGPHTFAPITWMCKKQGAVSHSSSEAERVWF